MLLVSIALTAAGLFGSGDTCVDALIGVGVGLLAAGLGVLVLALLATRTHRRHQRLLNQQPRDGR
jgi:hypothetical protein